MSGEETQVYQKLSKIEEKIFKYIGTLGKHRILVVQKYCSVMKRYLEKHGKMDEETKKTIEDIGLFTVREIETEDEEVAVLIYETAQYFRKNIEKHG